MERNFFQFSDVQECNHSCIHCKDTKGNQYTVKANDLRLQEIYKEAAERTVFYRRMSEDLYAVYQQKQAERESLKFYSQEEIESCGHDIMKSINMEHTNEESKWKSAEISGFFNALDYSWKQRDKYFKLAQQAKGALK